MEDVAEKLHSLNPVFTRHDAEVAGISRWVLARLVRHRMVHHETRGLYRRAVTPPEDEQRWQRIQRQHLERARLALCAHPDHALSHQSAALARGWPVSIGQDTPVHLTALSTVTRARRSPGVRLHRNTTLESDTLLAQGCRTLSAARTVADCLRTLSAERAVPIADGAVRAGDTTAQQVRAVLDAQTGWRGRPGALRVLRLVDARRETWLESFSFVRLHDRGLPLPTPQVQVCDDRGVFVARVDGMWVAEGVVAECDGTGKYLLDAEGRYGPDPRQAALRVVDEGKRERALERLGLLVVRWDTDEITDDGGPPAQRVEEARSRGDITRFRGRLRLGNRWVDLSRFSRSDRT